MYDMYTPVPHLLLFALSIEIRLGRDTSGVWVRNLLILSALSMWNSFKD